MMVPDLSPGVGTGKVPAGISPVRFEHADTTLGVGTPAPRLSWRMTDAGTDWTQTAYELELDGRTRVRVDSAEQVLVPWPFQPLLSRSTATVRVRAAARSGWSAWSGPASVETGLLTPEDWTARFISPRHLGRLGQRAPVMRHTVVVRPGFRSGRLYITALGLYDASLNGERVGDHLLAPGWTSYRHRLHYQTFDVTDQLRPGVNSLSVVLGNGWYRGRLGWTGRQALFGERLALLAQLEISYEDGTRDVVGTDTTWSASESDVLANDLYDGQRTDLRLPEGRTDSVEVLDEDLGKLEAADKPPVRATQTLSPIAILDAPSGGLIVDFGQNLVGWTRLHAHGARHNGEIMLRHAEVLENKELAVRPLRSAKAADTYVLAGQGAAVEPCFTFHGFRYAEVTGMPDLHTGDIEAVVVGSDLRRTGWFSCSDPELERLHENVVWSMRGNFLSVPTDCPQRDERLGWTGDIQLFAPTASFLFDTSGFLSSWLSDLAAEQHEDGSIPFVVPDVLGDTPLGERPAVAGWGDAATVVPWVLYERFGDIQILERQFDSMRRWVDKAMGLSANGVWAGGFQIGDWLDPAAPPHDAAAARADPDVLATAYLARSADLVARSAKALGRTIDAQHYERIAGVVRAGFAREYVSASGRLLSDAPTAYSLALVWDLLPTPVQRDGAGRRLADLVRGNGFRINTGFLGTPLIAEALTVSGFPELAYRLVLQRACPSWLYPVTMGATTIWERWDSLRPDGSINPATMTSFNHYALGAIADWLHRTVAGLAPAAPGYRKILIRPQPYHALTHAFARHETPYGEASAGWSRDGEALTIEAVVPNGSQATVHAPGGQPVTVGAGRHTWTVDDPCNHPQRSVSTVRDLMDAPRLWTQAVELLIRYNLGTDDLEVARGCARYLDMPATTLPRLLARTKPHARLAAVLTAFRELLASHR